MLGKGTEKEYVVVEVWLRETGGASGSQDHSQIFRGKKNIYNSYLEIHNKVKNVLAQAYLFLQQHTHHKM